MSVPRKNEQIEFETLEDVNIKNVQSKEIDGKITSYKCVMRNTEKNVAIQVKRTSMSTESAEKILYNWLIIEKSHDNINKYILFTDEEYENRDIIFDMDVKELLEAIFYLIRNPAAHTPKVNWYIDEIKALDILHLHISI